MAQKKLKRPSTKPSVKRRTVNRSLHAAAGGGSPTQHQDVKRRLGTFEGAGEHARVGGRTSGIVGQTTKKNRTDNRRKLR